MMLEKGQQYKERAQKLREEKASQETDGCSFMPQVNTKFKIASNNPVLEARYKPISEKQGDN